MVPSSGKWYIHLCNWILITQIMLLSTLQYKNQYSLKVSPTFWDSGTPSYGFVETLGTCCGQLWVWHMFCGKGLWWVMPPNKIHGSHWNTIGACPPFGVRFPESLVIRLYSEIGQIHLSTEAPCGTACLPLGDCHSTHPIESIVAGS